MNKNKMILLLLAMALAISTMLLPLTASAETANDYKISHTKPTVARSGYFNKYTYFPFKTELELEMEYTFCYKINNLILWNENYYNFIDNMTGKSMDKSAIRFSANGLKSIDTLEYYIDKIESNNEGSVPRYYPFIYFKIKFAYKYFIENVSSEIFSFDSLSEGINLEFAFPFKQDMILQDTVANKSYNITYSFHTVEKPLKIKYNFAYPNNNYVVNSLDIWLNTTGWGIGYLNEIHPKISIDLNDFSNISTFIYEPGSYSQIYLKDLVTSSFKINKFSVSSVVDISSKLVWTNSNSVLFVSFNMFSFNFYSKENNLVNTGGLGTNAEYKTCEWYDIPCHLGNAVVYMIYDFPLTKNITTFLASALNFFSETFGIINKFNAFGVIFVFAGGVLMLFIIKKVAGG